MSITSHYCLGCLLAERQDWTGQDGTHNDLAVSNVEPSRYPLEARPARLPASLLDITSIKAFAKKKRDRQSTQ